jgi:hypothetical protein
MSGTDEQSRRFEDWVANGGEKVLALPRFSACIMVRQMHVDSVLEGPPAEEPDTFGEGWVSVVCLYEEEGHVAVGASYLIPRAWTLVEAIGFSGIDPGEDYIFHT